MVSENELIKKLLWMAYDTSLIDSEQHLLLSLTLTSLKNVDMIFRLLTQLRPDVEKPMWLFEYYDYYDLGKFHEYLTEDEEETLRHMVESKGAEYEQWASENVA